MSGNGIRLSDKHGVNPSMALCFFCGKENGCIVLPGRLPGDAEAPRKAVWDMNPCPECQTLMGQGVLLIQVREGEANGPDPFRTGPICVVTDAFILRAVDAPLCDQILRARFAFVPEDAWRSIGLPEGEGGTP